MAERVQVQGLGEAPTVQPVDLPGYQYGIGQRRAGRNKAMDLADSLAQFGLITKQYGQLQVQQERIGAEQAEVIEEQNVIAELKKTKDIGGFHPLARYNRDRAYRDALLKRHITNKMLPSLQTKAQGLVDLEKYRNIGEFTSAVDETLNTEWKNLIGDVGEDIANTTASKALWNAVTPKYKSDLIVQYESAKDKFVLEEKLNEGQVVLDTFYSSGEPVSSSQIESFVNSFDAQLEESNPILTKADRSKALVGMIVTRAKTLQAQRRFTDASRLVQGVDTVRVNGNKIFGTEAALTALNPIRKEINNKIASLSSESKTVSDKEWSGLWGGALKRLPGSMTYDRFINNPLSVRTVKDALLFMNPTLEDGEEEGQLDYIIKNEIFKKDVAPALALNDALLTQAYNDPDRSLPLYRRTLKSVGTFLAETKGSLEREVNLYSPAVRENLVEEFLGLHETESAGGKKYDFDDFLGDKGIDATPWSNARQASKEANAGLFATELTEFKAISTKAKTDITGIAQSIAGDKKIDEVLPPKFDETHALTSVPIIKKKIIDYAKEVELDENIPAVEKQGMVVKELRRLQDEDKAIFRAVAEIAKGRVKEFERPEEIELKEERKTVDVEKARRKEGAGFPLEFFRDEPTKYKSLIQDKPTPSLINKDRQLIKASINNESTSAVEKERLTKLLTASVYDHGFSSYSPESAAILKQTDFDFGDVILFGNEDELNEVTLDEWLVVIDKVEQRQELTKEDETKLKELGDFRVYDSKSFDDFRRAQLTLMRDRDSR